jgi:hypothetical protein
MNDTRSGTSRHARCHSSSALSLFLSGVRARGFPALPSGPASSLDGKEGSTDACRRLRFATPQAPVQHSSRWLSDKTTTHPAPIPQEVAGSSRPYPTIPATRVSKDPAHGGNPRTSPPRPEAVRPACHAGGRGFESRRSRSSKALRSDVFSLRESPCWHRKCIVATGAGDGTWICVLSSTGAYWCPPLHEPTGPRLTENAMVDKRGVLKLDTPLTGTHPAPRASRGSATRATQA